MFNSQRPNPDDLPTSRQLFRATLIAAATAGAILVAIVLPSEYAIDPTGIGRALGYTQMGEIKAQLAEEAAADAAIDAAPDEAVQVAAGPAGPTAPEQAAVAAARTDTLTVELAPDEAAEIKVTALKGAEIAFGWDVAGGHVNFDTHGDAPGISYHGYGKGRESTGERGTLVAAFDGKHGWFWRNRSGAPVTITLSTEGVYSEIRRVV
jgi:hypothetical protein